MIIVIINLVRNAAKDQRKLFILNPPATHTVKTKCRHPLVPCELIISRPADAHGSSRKGCSVCTVESILREGYKADFNSVVFIMTML